MILSLVVLKRQPKDFYQMSRLRLNKDGGVSWLFQPWGRLGVEEVGGVISLLLHLLASIAGIFGCLQTLLEHEDI